MSRQVGERSFQTIRGFTQRRAIQGKIKKVKVKTHTRFNRYWGPAKPIPKQEFLRFSLKRKIKFGKKYRLGDLKLPAGVRSVLPKNDIQAVNKVLRMYRALPRLIQVGVANANRIYQKQYFEKIPSQSGSLRNDLMRTLEDNHKRYKRFPIVFKIGAPKTKHASIVEAYTPDNVQIQHRPGLQLSGKGSRLPGQKQQYLYNAGTGDPKAEYHFFTKAKKHALDAYYEGIRSAVLNADYRMEIFNYFIRVSPRWGTD